MRFDRSCLRAFVIVFGLALSPLAAGFQPGWVTDDSAEYPNELYLVGRGVGSTEVEAQNRARGDLAMVFEVRIEAVTESTTTVSQSERGQHVDKLAMQQVSARTDKVISGINIAKVWRNPETKDFYALAVLPRAQAAAGLREELSVIDEDLQQQMQAAETAGDKLIRIGALTKALQASTRREGFQATLKVVDPSGIGVRAPVSRASVQKLIDGTLKQVRIVPEVAGGEAAGQFASILKGGLAAAGFLATDPAAADLVLEGKLTLMDMGRREGWNWIRATVEVSLIEKGTRRVRGSHTWPVKAAAQDVQTARSRAMIEVEKVLKQELRSVIVGFAAG